MILSKKMADEIDLDLFSVFTLSYVSVLLVYLDLSNDIDLFNNIILYDLLLMGLSFTLLDSFGFSVSLIASIVFVSMGRVMDSFTTLGFVSM